MRVSSGGPWEEKVGYSHALKRCGGGRSDVVQTRMYVTDVALQEDVGRAHRELFGDVRPVATMVAVAGLAHPDHLVEVELTAYNETL